MNELIRQFCHLISYPASQFTQLSRVLILACMLGHTLCAVSSFSQSREVNTFVIDVESQWQGILTDVVHVSSEETYSIS